MSVKTDLYSTLNSNSGVRAIVGEATSPQQSKIYPVHVDSAACPYIVYTIADQPISTLAGVNDLHSYDITIWCYALTSDGADALADAVHDALEGNGYQSDRYQFYDSLTKQYSVILGWDQLA